MLCPPNNLKKTNKLKNHYDSESDLKEFEVGAENMSRKSYTYINIGNLPEFESGKAR